MLTGLAECEVELRELGVPFKLLQGDPASTLPAYVQQHDACAVVADFSPLRVGCELGGLAGGGTCSFPALLRTHLLHMLLAFTRCEWKKAVGAALPDVPLYEVDAHNVHVSATSC